MSHQIEGSGKGKEVIAGNGSGGEGGDDGCSRGGHGKKANRPPAGLVCPRCQSRNSKFSYYNNGSIYQPRYYCSDCRRYWTEGGIQRNIPVGGPNRRQRRSASDASPVAVIVLALPPSTIEQQQQLLAATATATGGAYSSVTAMHQRVVNQPTLNAFPTAGLGTNLGLVSNSFNLAVNRPLPRPQQQFNPYPYPHPGVHAHAQQQPINCGLRDEEQRNPGVQQQEQEQEAQEDEMSNSNPMGDDESASCYAFVDDWLDISAFMSSDNTTTNGNDNNNGEQANDDDLAGKKASS